MQIQGVKTRNKQQLDNMDFGHVWTCLEVFFETFCVFGFVISLQEPHMAGAASALLLQVRRCEDLQPADAGRRWLSGWKC